MPCSPCKWRSKKIAQAIKQLRRGRLRYAAKSAAYVAKSLGRDMGHDLRLLYRRLNAMKRGR